VRPFGTRNVAAAAARQPWPQNSPFHIGRYQKYRDIISISPDISAILALGARPNFGPNKVHGGGPLLDRILPGRSYPTQFSAVFYDPDMISMNWREGNARDVIEAHHLVYRIWNLSQSAAYTGATMACSWSRL
jgi:hypothetical protein